MDSAPRRSYSALPWEKRRERPLACVALPRREPVRRVVHLERAPADGRTVAARGGQLLRRVAHVRARAPSPGLAVRYDARVRPGGRAACLAGLVGLVITLLSWLGLARCVVVASRAGAGVEQAL